MRARVCMCVCVCVCIYTHTHLHTTQTQVSASVHFVWTRISHALFRDSETGCTNRAGFCISIDEENRAANISARSERIPDLYSLATIARRCYNCSPLDPTHHFFFQDFSLHSATPLIINFDGIIQVSDALIIQSESISGSGSVLKTCVH